MPKDFCEICNKSDLVVDIHHIHSISLGGKDREWNKCKLCPNCHRLVHMGEIVLEGKFGSTNGMVLVWRYFGEESVTGLDDPYCWIYGKRNKIETVLYDLKCFLCVEPVTFIDVDKIIDYIL